MGGTPGSPKSPPTPSSLYFSLSESPFFHILCIVLFISTFVPQKRRVHKGLTYGLLASGFLMAAVWVYVTHFGLTVFFVYFVLTSLSFVQTLYVLYHNKQTNLSPSFDKLYMELFRPLKMPLKEYKKLVQDPDVRLRSMAPGETYAIEGVSVPDQLSLLVSGCVHVYVEGKFIHKIDEFSFLDSPEWESFSEEFPEHFQVTLTAIRHSTYISWPRKVLEAILYDNPYLNSTMTNLIGRDITNKLYLLNQQARTPSTGSKPSAKELRSIWSDASKPNCGNVGVGGLKKPETGSLTALREMRSTERQNTFGDSIYGSMGDSFDEIKRNNSGAQPPGGYPSSSVYAAATAGINAPVVLHNNAASSTPQHNQHPFPCSSPFNTGAVVSGTPTHTSNLDPSFTLYSSSNLNYPPNHYPHHSPFSPPLGLINRHQGALAHHHKHHNYSMELKEVISSTTTMLQTALYNLNDALMTSQDSQSSLLNRKVASMEGPHTSQDVSRSRTVTPHTQSTESDPTNPTFTQGSPPVIKMHPDEDTVLTIRVPVSDKPIGSYESPSSVSMGSRVGSGSHPDITRAPRYGEMQQSTSSSTDPSLSLEEETISVSRRRIRPLIRSKQIIAEEEHSNGSSPSVSSAAISKPSPLMSSVVVLNSSGKTSTECSGPATSKCISKSSSAIGLTSTASNPLTAQVQALSEKTLNRPSNLPIIIEPEIVINPGTPTPEDQDSELEYKWWSSLQQDSIDDPHYFVSLSDMTGVPHSNHTTIEEEEITEISTPSPKRRGSNLLTDGIDIESMESDMLDPTTEIDEILKKAASSLASSRNSQTSDESPRRCSEEETSPGASYQTNQPHNFVGSQRRKNSIGIQVPHRRSPKFLPPQLSVDSGSSAGLSDDNRKCGKVSRMLNQFNLGQTLDSSLSDSIATSMESDLNSAQGSNKRNSLSTFSRQNTMNSDVDLVLFSTRLSRQNSENSSMGHSAGNLQGMQGSQNSLRSTAFSPIIPEELENTSENKHLKAETSSRLYESRASTSRKQFTRRKLRQNDRFSSVDTPSITITNAMDVSPSEDFSPRSSKENESKQADKLIPASPARSKRFLPHGYSLD